MSSTHSSDVRSQRRQVAALLQRVSSLERILKAEKQAARSVRRGPPRDRKWEELDAQMTAMSEYSRHQLLESYRGRPESLRAALASERKRNAFFRERGVKPPKSTLTSIAKQLAEESRNKRAENASLADDAAANSATKDGR